MGRPRKERKPLPPIWRVSDELWAIIEPILDECDPAPRMGRKRVDRRGVLDAVIFRLRTGCRWNWLPAAYPDDSSAHRTFQRWIARGVFERIWAVLPERCEDLGGVDWEWQAADGALGKARPGGDLVGPNPTDRGKAGVKRSLLVEKDGGPLAVVIAGANVPDAQLLAATLDAVAVERPEPEDEYPQHLCPDKGDDNDPGREATVERDYEPHIALIRDRRPPRPTRFKPKRWVVERTPAWLSQCRAIPVRRDKQAKNYLGLLKLAGALLWFRRYHRLAHLR